MRRASVVLVILLLSLAGLPGQVSYAAPEQAIAVASKPVLRRGDRGPRVRELQIRLNVWITERPTDIPLLPITGNFGPQTEETVKMFQSEKQLPVTGVVGPQTWGRLPAAPVQASDPCAGVPAAVNARMITVNCVPWGQPTRWHVTKFRVSDRVVVTITSPDRTLFFQSSTFTLEPRYLEEGFGWHTSVADQYGLWTWKISNVRSGHQTVVYIKVLEESATAPDRSNCASSYQTLCIPINHPDLDCDEIPWRRFPVRPPDPHGFDGDSDGVGCEWD